MYPFSRFYWFELLSQSISLLANIIIFPLHKRFQLQKKRHWHKVNCRLFKVLNISNEQPFSQTFYTISVYNNMVYLFKIQCCSYQIKPFIFWKVCYLCSLIRGKEQKGELRRWKINWISEIGFGVTIFTLVWNRINLLPAEFLNTSVMQLCNCAQFCNVCAKSWMCSPKLEKSCNFTSFTCFLHVFTPFMWLFWGFFCAFSCTNFFK